MLQPLFCLTGAKPIVEVQYLITLILGLMYGGVNEQNIFQLTQAQYIIVKLCASLYVSYQCEFLPIVYLLHSELNFKLVEPNRKTIWTLGL